MEDKLSLFQSENKLTIPDDLKSYLRLSDNEIDEYSEGMFTFFKLDEFKSVKDAVGDYGGTPDYRRIVEVLPEHENCFVFAEYFLYVMVFAIRLYEKPTGENEVYVIMGDKYELVAKSFSEFINLYNDDFNNLFVI